ncbi:hypothetical protein [Lewinella sp. IMCC34183]|uniref:hypothetical protein n=1 Tax=Lewinella sp. IMCC34183 TaxID=2248762 RepID=UPI000E276197|nr:hypothetical protein [Lewinella sp. IMCC34183]
MSNHTLDGGFVRPAREITDPKEIVRINDLKLEANEQSKKVRYGRYVLYFLMGMSLLYGLGLGYFGSGDVDSSDEALWGGIIMAVLYGGFAGLTFRWPAVGMGLGLALYLFDHTLAALEDPTTVLNGIFVKAAVLFGLGIAIVSVFRLRNLLASLAAHRIPEEELALGRRWKDIPRTPQVKKTAAPPDAPFSTAG